MTLLSLPHVRAAGETAEFWSRDRDLRRFDAVTVTDPFDDRYADGFPRR